jgi:hypothetical protein
MKHYLSNEGLLNILYHMASDPYIPVLASEVANISPICLVILPSKCQKERSPC